MEKSEFHRKAVEEIRKNRIMAKGGTENSVFEIPESDYVSKVSKGSMVKFVNYNGIVRATQKIFDVTNVSPEIRKSFIIDHTLAKILHILFPSSIPNRLGLHTKFYPRYMQEKVLGKKEYQDVKRVNGKITDNDMETKTRWDNEIEDFKTSLKNLGIEIDTKNQVENFIKTENGKYKYVDTFSFSDPNFVINKIKEKIIELQTKGKINLSSSVRLEHLLKRFERLTS